ncbi:hypothetical protein [Nibricoccus aquaticus]|nr:hypothetical protein [Nibricoccus aquaticus]
MPDDDVEPEMINQAFRKRDAETLLALLDRLEPKFKYTPAFVHIRLARTLLKRINRVQAKPESAKAHELTKTWDEMGQKIFDMHLAISRSL